MSRKYKFRDDSRPYFITLTVVDWIDVFTRDIYRSTLVDSFKYCIKSKGLVIHAWCIMTNHLHLIISSQTKPLQDIVRDLKRFTSSELKKQITQNVSESRRDWMLASFHKAGNANNNNGNWQFWIQNNHPIELSSNHMMDQKLNYVHQNPVTAGFVSKGEDWVWSSARNYSGEQGMIELSYIRSKEAQA